MNGSGMASRFLVSQISLQSWERRGQLSKDERAPVRDSWKQQTLGCVHWWKSILSGLILFFLFIKAELGVSCARIL